MEATVFMRLARPQPSGGGAQRGHGTLGPISGWGRQVSGKEQHRRPAWEARVLHTCEWYPTLRVTPS